jgi:hypothetical protein
MNATHVEDSFKYFRSSNLVVSDFLTRAFGTCPKSQVPRRQNKILGKLRKMEFTISKKINYNGRRKYGTL